MCDQIGVACFAGTAATMNKMEILFSEVEKVQSKPLKLWLE